VTTAPR